MSSDSIWFKMEMNVMGNVSCLLFFIAKIHLVLSLRLAGLVNENAMRSNGLSWDANETVYLFGMYF